MKYLKKFKTESDVVITDTPIVYLVNTTKRIGYVQGALPARIQHVDGSLYSAEEWIERGFTNDQANGIAIETDTGSIVLAKEVFKGPWGPEGELPVTNEEFGTGEANTDAIINAVGDNGGVAYAVKTARDYTFPDGTKGFLPSIDELKLISPIIKLVNSLLLTIGGDQIDDSTTGSWNYIQSSTNKNKLSGGKYYIPAIDPSDDTTINTYRYTDNQFVVIKYLS